MVIAPCERQIFLTGQRPRLGLLTRVVYGGPRMGVSADASREGHALDEVMSGVGAYNWGAMLGVGAYICGVILRVGAYTCGAMLGVRAYTSGVRAYTCGLKALSSETMQGVGVRSPWVVAPL